MDKLQLEVLFKAIDQATSPIKAVREASKEVAGAVRDAQAALKGLEKQQGLIAKFQETSKWLSITEKQLAGAQQRARELKLEMDATDSPTKKMIRNFEVASKEAETLEQKHKQLIEKEQNLGEALKRNNIDLAALSQHQEKLKIAAAAATVEVERQSSALVAQNEKLRAVNAAQAEYRKLIELRNKFAVGGAVTMATGAAMGAPIAAAVRDYANFEDAMLGVAKQMAGARDANGNLTKSYFEMGRAIKSMSEQLPVSAKDIAAIVEAGARNGIQGQENLLTYARETTIASKAMELSADETGASMSALATMYDVPIAKLRELGDTINYLDDNTNSKSGPIIDVLKRIGGTMDGKMNFREAAALGSTFLSLGAGAEVAASASSAMVRELSIATMQGKRFQDGMAMLNLDAKSIQSGMSTNATETIIKVMEAIKSLPQQQQLEATTRLFGKEFGDDAAKLAANLADYRMQLGLANSAQSGGSTGREMEAQLKSLSAKKQLLDNSFENISSDIGESMKSPLIGLMEEIRDILHGTREWVNAHPVLVATLVKIAAVVAVVTIGIGALAMGIAAILGTLAAAKLAMNILGIQGLGIGRIFTSLGNLFPWLGKGILALGRVMMANPILAIVSAIGLAAMYIWQNWDEIKPRLARTWGYIVSSYASIRDWIKAKLSELVAWFKNLATEFLGIGSSIVSGIINGIKARWGALKNTVIGLGRDAVGWLKSILGINSPSRVFQDLGLYTMQGLERGITGGQGAPLAAIARMAKQLAGAGAGMMLGAGAAIANVDHRPPLAASTMAGGYTVINHITIQAGPGMNEKTLAQEVTRQIDELERARAARGRSRFGDRA